MSQARSIPPAIGLLGAVVCCLVIAVEFALGFHVRGLSLNLALGLSWLLVVAFALFSYGARGSWVLLSVPVGAYLLTSMSWQLNVACTLNSQSCP